jgi:hypothetical protein
MCRSVYKCLFSSCQEVGVPVPANVHRRLEHKEPDYSDMVFLACLIPWVCHNVYQVCYVWGGLVRDQVLNITPTFLTSNVLNTLRQVDHVASQLRERTARY